MEKTMRFGDLVRVSGRPEAVTLWADPKKDRSFSKAVRENRVLTINEDPRSTKKEYGQIGFHRSHNATYFLFPRPLPKQQDARIIGINYMLAEDAPPADPLQHSSSSKARKAKIERLKPSAPPKPVLKSFEVLIRRTATLEMALRVKAADEREARKLASDTIKRKRFDISKAILRDEVMAVKARD
jgi:hypothetical protein